MENLPDELLELILLNLNCKEILAFSKICQRFSRLNIQSLIDKRKIKGFPRKGGSVVHKMIDDNLYYMSDNIENDFLDLIYDRQIDIIKGDLVTTCDRYQFGHDILIFDGLKLLYLEYYNTSDGDVHIPNEFHVIENNVPITYWHDIEIRLFDPDVVWFDHTLVKTQFNIEYGVIDFRDINETYGIYTKFIYYGIQYYIICDYYDDFSIQDKINQDNYSFLDDITKNEMMKIFERQLNRNKFHSLCSDDVIENHGDILFLHPY